MYARVVFCWFQLPFYYRYVDDIITAVPSNEIKTIQSIFNSYNHKIQFTIEEESGGKICFLDIMIIRDKNSIKTNWYHKPTWSGRFLNFHSHHPYKYKINVINNLVDRGITLAHKDFHNENIKNIKSNLITNSYPPNLIDSIIRKWLNLLSKSKNWHWQIYLFFTIHFWTTGLKTNEKLIYKFLSSLWSQQISLYFPQKNFFEHCCFSQNIQNK